MPSQLHKRAFIDRVANEAAISKTQAEKAVDAFLGGIQRALARGDRVAFYLRPSVSLPLAIFAVSQADGVFIPVHHGLFPDQVAHESFFFDFDIDVEFIFVILADLDCIGDQDAFAKNVFDILDIVLFQQQFNLQWAVMGDG